MVTRDKKRWQESRHKSRQKVDKKVDIKVGNKVDKKLGKKVDKNVDIKLGKKVIRKLGKSRHKTRQKSRHKTRQKSRQKVDLNLKERSNDGTCWAPYNPHILKFSLNGSHNRGGDRISARSTHPMIRDNFYLFRTDSTILYVINTRGYTVIAWVLASMLPELRE